MSIELVGAITPFVYKYRYILIMISGLLEGASIPFPGYIVLMIAGFIAYQGQIEIGLVVILNAFFYSVASLIPYYIGKNLKGRLFDFMGKKLKVSQRNINYIERIFNKYGEISICLTRPFFIGNYISYMGGMANTPIIKFLILTFIGILPMIGFYLGLGYFFRGNFYQMEHFLAKYKTILLLMMVLKVGIIITWFMKKKSPLKNK